MRSLGFWLVAVVSVGGGFGCGDDTPEACLPALSRTCQTQYEPKFDEFWKRRLSKNCSTTEACHASETAKGARDGHGLVLSEADLAYGLLLGSKDGRARVIAGDPECSLLMRRLTSKDPNFQMPPGAPLDPSEICTITQWIANGAKR